MKSGNFLPLHLEEGAVEIFLLKDDYDNSWILAIEAGWFLGRKRCGHNCAAGHAAELP